jgi:DNA-binding transcriptional LysR family regulator
VQAGADAVRAVHGLQRGTITLGVMQQMTLIDLPRTLARYSRQHPGIELRLQHAAARDLHQLVIQGAVDIAVTTPPQRPDSRLAAVELLRTPLVLVCRDDDPLATRRAVTASELSERRLVGFPEGWAIHTLAERFTRRSGVTLKTHFEANDTETALDLVAAGLGVALIAEALAGRRRGLRTVPLRGRVIDWVIAAVAVAPAPVNPAARDLWRRITRSAAAEPRAERSRDG